MKRHQPSFRQFWENVFGTFRNLPSPNVDPAWQRILDRLQDDPLPAFEFEETSRRRRSPWVMAAVAASLLAAVGLAGVVAFRNSPDPFVAVAENQSKIRIGEAVQSPQGMKLTLTDGSRLTMRSGAELSFYREGSDLCIQLVRGDLVVNAAKQEAGHHLCVLTKDFIVTVIGTVFTVRVEARGSSVIVEEGTVWVQQGPTRKPLVAGQRFSTIAAKPEAPPQVSASIAAPPPQAPPQARETAKPSPKSFEVVSIKRVSPDQPAGSGRRIQFSPGGFLRTNVTLKDLIGLAYGLQAFQISGGPAWINDDRFDVDARLGVGVALPMETPKDLAPFLLMIQDMLATRFKLKVNRTAEQTAVYALTIAGQASKLQEVPESIAITSREGGRNNGSYRSKSTIAEFTFYLTGIVGQPVVDRTGLQGYYDINLVFLPESLAERLVAGGGAGGGGGGRGGRRGGGGGMDLLDLRSALQEQLGLKLEQSRAPVEFLVIESVEQPSEN